MAYARDRAGSVAEGSGGGSKDIMQRRMEEGM